MQVPDSACNLLEEMPADNLIEPTNRGIGIGILFDHITRCLVFAEGGSLLDECGQVAELAELHHQVHLGFGFDAVEKSDNVRMMELAEDLDFCIEVLPQLSAELCYVD